MKVRFSVLFVVVALFAIASAATANMLANGDFEAKSGMNSNVGVETWWTPYTPGGVVFNSWTVKFPTYEANGTHIAWTFETTLNGGNYGPGKNYMPIMYNGNDAMRVRPWGSGSQVHVFQDVAASGNTTYTAGALVHGFSDPSRAPYDKGFGSSPNDYANVVVEEFTAGGVSNGVTIIGGINTGDATTVFQSINGQITTKVNTATLRFALDTYMMETYDKDLGPLAQGWVTWDDAYVNAVPEPGSLVALGSGIIGLLGFGIRRRK